LWVRFPPGSSFDSPSPCLRRAEDSLMAGHPLVECAVLAAVVNTTVVADENLTVGSTVWLLAESLAPGR
jgi:hypothetical protein